MRPNAPNFNTKQFQYVCIYAINIYSLLSVIVSVTLQFGRFFFVVAIVLLEVKRKFNGSC